MTAALATLAAAGLLIAGLDGCASQLTPMPNRPATVAAPYVGVFTGQFVDGQPLYRFPAIEVVGLRSSLGAGSRPD